MKRSSTSSSNNNGKRRPSDRLKKKTSILTFDELGTCSKWTKKQMIKEGAISKENPYERKGRELYKRYQTLFRTFKPKDGNWGFYLSRYGSVKDVQALGTRGVHYCVDYHELGLLRMKHGEDISKWPDLPPVGKHGTVSIVGRGIKEEFLFRDLPSMRKDDNDTDPRSSISNYAVNDANHPVDAHTNSSSLKSSENFSVQDSNVYAPRGLVPVESPTDDEITIVGAHVSVMPSLSHSFNITDESVQLQQRDNDESAIGSFANSIRREKQGPTVTPNKKEVACDGKDGVRSRVPVLEEIIFGEESTGSMLSRIIVLEKTVFGEEKTGGMVLRITVLEKTIFG
jgi:hypothetical protein